VGDRRGELQVSRGQDCGIRPIRVRSAGAAGLSASTSG
jgi:hypothetical protein